MQAQDGGRTLGITQMLGVPGEYAKVARVRKWAWGKGMREECSPVGGANGDAVGGWYEGKVCHTKVLRRANVQVVRALHPHLHVPRSNDAIFAAGDEPGRRRAVQDATNGRPVVGGDCLRAHQQRHIPLVVELVLLLELRPQARTGGS